MEIRDQEKGGDCFIKVTDIVGQWFQSDAIKTKCEHWKPGTDKNYDQKLKK